MAKVKGVTFGGNKATIVAGRGGYTLAIPNLPYDTSSRGLMLNNIKELIEDLNEIKWEMEREYGVFRDFIKEEKDEEEDFIPEEDEVEE